MTPAKRGDIFVYKQETRVSYVKGPGEIYTQWGLGVVMGITRDGTVAKWVSIDRPDDLHKGRPSELALIQKEKVNSSAMRDAYIARSSDWYSRDFESFDEAKEFVKRFLK